MDILNYIFYMDGHHKFMFDEQNIIFHLETAGFRDCHLRNYDPTIDSKERDYESLYISSVK